MDGTTPRPHPFRDRLLVVGAGTLLSTGTVVLGLAGTDTAWAATSASHPVAAHPHPGPIHQLVQQVSQAAGVPDPLGADPDATPTHRRHRGGSPARVGAGWHAPRAERRAAVWVEHAVARRPHPAVQHRDVVVPAGLRAAPPAPQPARAVPPKASVADVATTTPSAVTVLRELSPGTSTGRLIAVVLGTMVIGTLAAGHVKTAQDRLAALAG